MQVSRLAKSPATMRFRCGFLYRRYDAKGDTLALSLLGVCTLPIADQSGAGILGAVHLLR